MISESQPLKQEEVWAYSLTDFSTPSSQPTPTYTGNQPPLKSPSVNSDIFPIVPRIKAAHIMHLPPFFLFGSHLLWLLQPWKRQCFRCVCGNLMFPERCPVGADFAKGFVTYALEYQWPWSWSYAIFMKSAPSACPHPFSLHRAHPRRAEILWSVILLLSWSSLTSPTMKGQTFPSFRRDSKTTVQTNPLTDQWRRSTFGVSWKPGHTAMTPRTTVSQFSVSVCEIDPTINYWRLMECLLLGGILKWM